LLPDAGPLTSGTFKPTNITAVGSDGPDTFPPPAPDPATCGTSLAVFNGTNPNGVWKLFVTDDFPVVDGGSINSWSLQITAKVKVKHKHHH
jgi:hypothetical protein